MRAQMIVRITFRKPTFRLNWEMGFNAILARYRRAVSRSASAVSEVQQWVSEAFYKQQSAAKGLTSGNILPHRHDFEKCFEGTSACLAQVGRCNSHPDLLGEQFDQHHAPTLAIRHLVDALNASKRHFCQKMRSP